MKREDFWNLFWLSGMPEAWLMSRPRPGEPGREAGRPPRETEENKTEQGGV